MRDRQRPCEQQRPSAVPSVGSAGRLPTVAAARMWHLARTAPSRPAVRVALVLQILGGAVGATAPTALAAAPEGAGVGTGAAFGAVAAMWVACATMPVILTSLGRLDGEDSRALYLTGWAPRSRIPMAAAAGSGVCCAGVASAAAVGAVVGLGDAWRHGTDPWSALQTPTVPWAALGTSVALTLALLSIGKASGAAASAVLTGWVGFVLLLAPTRGTWVRTAVEWAPFAPAWTTMYRDGSYRLLLSMSAAQVTVVGLVWAVIVVVTMAVGVWRSQPPR